MTTLARMSGVRSPSAVRAMFEISAEVCGETVSRTTGNGAPVFATGNSMAVDVRAFIFISTFRRKRPESVARASAPSSESCANAAGANRTNAGTIARLIRRMEPPVPPGRFYLGVSTCFFSAAIWRSDTCSFGSASAHASASSRVLFAPAASPFLS